jgi:hypothetical protein
MADGTRVDEQRMGGMIEDGIILMMNLSTALEFGRLFITVLEKSASQPSGCSYLC